MLQVAGASYAPPAHMHAPESDDPVMAPTGCKLTGPQERLDKQHLLEASCCHGSDDDRLQRSSSGADTPCEQASSASIHSYSSSQSSKDTQVSLPPQHVLGTDRSQNRTRPQFTQQISSSHCSPGQAYEAQLPGAWRPLAGSGSHFIRAVGTTCQGYLESNSQEAHADDSTSTALCSTNSALGHHHSTNYVAQDEALCCSSFIMATWQPAVQQPTRFTTTGNLQLSVNCRFTPTTPAIKTACSAARSLYQVVIGWQRDGHTASQSYIAVQADCKLQQWSVVQVQMPGKKDQHPRTTVLATAMDRHLEAGSFCKLELQMAQRMLTLHRSGTNTCLFSNVPLTAVPVAAPSSPAAGPSEPCVNEGYLGLGVCYGRLEFCFWQVATLQAASTPQVKGQPTPTARSQNAAVKHRSDSKQLVQGETVKKQHGHTRKQERELCKRPDYAHNVFGRISPAVATAVAVSTSGAAAGRWSRRPHISDADPHMVEAIMADIITPNHTQLVSFDDVASLAHAKQLLHEAVVLPLLLPNLFTGIRSPWKGVLLFGPPGTGKTMLARAVASTAGITFFATSSASLTSKWRGDSEKLVRTLFAVAAHYAPAVIFMDEIDALASCNDMDGEGDASRRFRAELLQQLDGIVSGAAAMRATTSNHQRVMLLAATNRPWALDAALRRRLEKRVLVPLPDREARQQLFSLYLQGLALADDINLHDMARFTKGYSGADIKVICRDAAMQPMRRLVHGQTTQQLKHLHRSGPTAEQLLVEQQDLLDALSRTQPSVSGAQVFEYQQWEQEFAAM